MNDPILKLPYKVKATNTPHVYWVDLYNNNIAVQVAVMAFDQRNRDLHFMRIDSLDAIDQNRLIKVLSRRDARNYALWDLLSQQTLKNGMNALEFFHQFVKIRTVHGPILNAGSSMRGFGDAASKPVSFDDIGNSNTLVDTTAQLPQPARRAGRPPTKRS